MHLLHIWPSALAIVNPFAISYISFNTNSRRRSKTMDIFGSYKKWRSYRRTVNELNTLSNRELHDLGINRGDIPFLARTGK